MPSRTLIGVGRTLIGVGRYSEEGPIVFLLWCHFHVIKLFNF